MADPHLPTIHFYPQSTPIGETKATFAITLQGVRAGQKIELTIFEVGGKQERRVGAIKGTAVATDVKRIPIFTIEPDAPPPPPPKTEGADAKPTIAFVLTGRQEQFIFEIPVERYDQWEGERFVFEARLTEPKVVSSRFQVAHIRRQLPVGAIASYDWHAHNEVKLYHHGGDDPGGSGGAFADMLAAINAAKSFIFIADWSFQPHFQVNRGASGEDATIGKALSNAAKKPEMLIAIHAWDHTNLAAPDEQNDHGSQRLDELCGGTRPKNLLWRVSSRSDFGMSHHQKFVVLDVDAGDGRREIKAFFGGLDLTKGRFDFDAHPIMPKDPAAAGFRKKVHSGLSWRGVKGIWLSKADYDDWYNGEFEDDVDAPREPWHDIHGQILGPAAWDVVREFVGRWNVDPSSNVAQGDMWRPGQSGEDDLGNEKFVKQVKDKFLSLFKGDADGVPKAKQFVQQFEARKKGPWSAQVYRSLKREHWGVLGNGGETSWEERPAEFQWRLSGGFEKSIQYAYQRAIDYAQHFIYIETQYLISGGTHWGQSIVANTLAERICARIVQKKGTPFHCFIVTPMYPEGPPASMCGVAVRQYEWKTMEWMVAELTRKLGAGPDEWQKYLSFYFPANWEKLDGGQVHLSTDRKRNATVNKRYMIYVHSKLMIVDDRYAILGSANLNERSLNGGHDSEICIGMWPTSPAVEQECIDATREFRVHLMSEHLGKKIAGLEHPENVAPLVQQMALQNYFGYRHGVRLPEHGALLRLPLEFDDATNTLAHGPLMVPAADFDEFLPDWPYDKAAFDKALGKTRKKNPAAFCPDDKEYMQWLWSCPGNWALLGGKIPA